MSIDPITGKPISIGDINQWTPADRLEVATVLEDLKKQRQVLQLRIEGIEAVIAIYDRR